MNNPNVVLAQLGGKQLRIPYKDAEKYTQKGWTIYNLEGEVIDKPAKQKELEAFAITIAHLSDENETLKSENETLKAKNAELEAELAKVTKSAEAEKENAAKTSKTKAQE